MSEDIVSKALRAVDWKRVEGLGFPVEREVRAMCHYLIPERWRDEGVSNSLRIGRFRFTVGPQGSPVPFEIVVAVCEDGKRNIIWYRVLSNRDEGVPDAAVWLEATVKEGYAEFLKVSAGQSRTRRLLAELRAKLHGEGG